MAAESDVGPLPAIADASEPKARMQAKRASSNETQRLIGLPIAHQKILPQQQTSCMIAGFPVPGASAFRVIRLIEQAGQPDTKMVKIRLSRGGAKKQPFYQIVVADIRRARDGRNIERIGFFDPCARGSAERLRLDRARAEHWLSKGAQPTERVAKLLKEAAKQAEASPLEA